MKLSNGTGTVSKDKIIEMIKEFFDTKFIDDTARLTKFVQRESKLQEWRLIYPYRTSP